MYELAERYFEIESEEKFYFFKLLRIHVCTAAAVAFAGKPSDRADYCRRVAEEKLGGEPEDEIEEQFRRADLE